jgi:hypothetical protein
MKPAKGQFKLLNLFFAGMMLLGISIQAAETNSAITSTNESLQKEFISYLLKEDIINNEGSYVVDGVLRRDKSLISNEEQILKKLARF